MRFLVSFVALLLALSTTAGAQQIASGGDDESVITQDGVTYRVHTFNSSGTLTVNNDVSGVEYVIVGGGSSGYAGNWSGAGCHGGAAGEFKSGSLSSISTGTYGIVVGSGGARYTGSSTTGRNGGGASSALGVSSAGGNGEENGTSHVSDITGSQIGYAGDGGDGGQTGHGIGGLEQNPNHVATPEGAESGSGWNLLYGGHGGGAGGGYGAGGGGGGCGNNGTILSDPTRGGAGAPPPPPPAP